MGVLIIGAGFSGLGAAITLQQAGRRDYLVIERGADVGGTWRDNTYPGAACDVESQLYSFSFAPNREWTQSFSSQAEIQDYLRRLARDSGVLDRIVLDCEVLASKWDDSRAQWDVQTSRGDYTASILVPAFGALAEPARPAIPGLDDFDGPIIHSARWPHDVDLAGKRVAVIGTGASAIQLVPAIAGQVAHVDVYQRTPPWVLPHKNRTHSPRRRALLRHLPGYRRLVRALIWATREVTAIGFAYRPGLLGIARRQAQAQLRRQVADPDLRRRLTPDYAIGCKRVLLSDEWYPTLQRPNVELIATGIGEVRSADVVDADGVARPVDAIVLATGFRVTDSPAADRITGVHGQTLGSCWREFGQQAYKGTAVVGFPNCFLLVGPNTGLGHSSMIYIIESQLAYLMDALATIDRHGLATVAVRQSAQDRYNRRLRRRMDRTVWSTGCRSWYLDARGHNTTLWPGFSFAFRWATRHFDLAAYRSTAREDLAAPGGAR